MFDMYEREIRLRRNFKNYLFVGYTDQIEEGDWVTIFGRPYADSGFVNWGQDEPNNYDGDEDCGALFYDDERGYGVNDVKCYRFLPYICERPINCEQMDTEVNYKTKSK